MGSPSGRNVGSTLAGGPDRPRRSGILTGVSDLHDIRDAARAFRAERDWDKFQDPKSVVLALVGEVGELAEVVQWLPADEAQALLVEEPLRTAVTDEMADVLVYLVTLADVLGVDLGPAALAKIEKSALKHRVDAVRGAAPRKGPVDFSGEGRDLA